MPTNLEKLRSKLAELFQLDQADLDFGIYRIMNSKREEILRFLDKDLLPQVQAAFAKYSDSGTASVATELAALEARLKADGVEPSQSKKYQELAAKLEEAKKGGLTDAASLEQEVFSDLYNFFSRYYDEGDFLSLRRYKAGVYAVPYEGEEVYLHWANKDQYYIKTTEYLRDYAFKLSDGRRVHFKLVEANTETDNKKEQQGQERRFILDADEPMAEEIGADGKAELFIRFHYKPVAGEKKKQAELNSKAIAAIFASKKFGSWTTALSKLDPSPSNSGRTLLEKHLNGYTARNTFDYFIHKDLGGFLRRELDFFVKNEVMHLDDIESDTAPRVEQYLAKIRALRAIADKIIQFLSQLEGFQKRLWLKQKFAVETRYFVSLDRIPESLYAEIAHVDAQRTEWIRLFKIDDIKGDLHTPGYAKKLTVDFLKAHKHLVVDTGLLPQDLGDRVVAAISEISESLTGLLVHADSFHALRLLGRTYSGRCSAIFVDPPYNTGLGDFAYKDSFQHSSWMSMIVDRISAGWNLLSSDGSLWVTLDDKEAGRFRALGEQTFGNDRFVADIAWQKVYSPRMDAKQFSSSFDHVLVFATRSDWSPRHLQIEPDLDQFPHTDEDGRKYRSDPLRKWGKNSRREDRPNLWYPIKTPDGKKQVWPIKPDGTEGCWRWQKSTVAERFSELDWLDKGNGLQPYLRQYADESTSRPVETFWSYEDAGSTHESQEELKAIVPKSGFATPKPTRLIQQVLKAAGGTDCLVADFFAGTGTTGNAVLNANRADGGNRRFVLCDIGDWFDSVLVTRLLRAAYDSNWSDGEPQERKGISVCYKLLRLESYDDTLNNLSLSRDSRQDGLLANTPTLREDYTLRYMLDFESRDSMLRIEQFSDPYAYKLKIHRNGETQEVAVDLVETFNWLLGLTVKSISVVRNVRVVEGTNPEGQKVLVLWRRTVGKDAVDNDALNKWFEKSQYSTKDREFDLIYVNGDNHLENVRSSPEHAEAIWKVRLIEAEFQRLMFEDCE